MDTINVKIIPDESGKIIKREIASLVFAIGASVLIVIVQRKISDPDFVLTCRMRVFNSIARYADARAHYWSQISSKATDLYLTSRP